MSGPGAAAGRIVILRTASGVPPGLLFEPAWATLRAATSVLTADAGHRQLAALRAAGLTVEVATAAEPELLVERAQAAAGAGPVVWLAGAANDPAPALFVDAGLDVAELMGSVDPPGARLLDVVATMDRLRSPGGCPWDAEQTHASLAKYLLEEAYEAYETIELGDLNGLREEIGDVLLQVCFHARLAEELPPEQRWDIDDVAAGLVEKLVRRHPHVFADTVVSGSDEVVTNWASIKAGEKNRSSVADGVPLSQPALALAAKLQQRAAAAGLPGPAAASALGSPLPPAQAVVAAAKHLGAEPDDDPIETVGDLLFAAVALARSVRVDPEAALRAAARRFRDQLAEATD